MPRRGDVYPAGKPLVLARDRRRVRRLYDDGCSIAEIHERTGFRTDHIRLALTVMPPLPVPRS
jgi:hypothetical protein